MFYYFNRNNILKKEKIAYIYKKSKSIFEKKII